MRLDNGPCPIVQVSVVWLAHAGSCQPVGAYSSTLALLGHALSTRAQLVRMRVDLANQIRGVLKSFGLLAGKGNGQPFVERVRTLVADGPLQDVTEVLLSAWQAINVQINILSRRLIVVSRADETVKRLMTAPGVGVLVALTYVSVIDDPQRFSKSSSVGAYLGLTPRRFQSGGEDYTGHISRCGDKLLRGYLFEAAGIVFFCIVAASGRPSKPGEPGWQSESEPRRPR